MTEHESNHPDEETHLLPEDEREISDVPVKEQILDEVGIPEGQEEAKAIKEESKVRRFSRKLLRWAMGLLAVFGLGAITAIVFIYQPTLERLNEAKTALQTAQSDIKTLEGKITEDNTVAQSQIDDIKATAQTEIDDLKKEIESLSTLSETNQKLQESLKTEILRTYLLSALADVHAAQYSLAQEDQANAQVHLTNTTKKLETIKTLVAENHAGVLENMLNRLDLVLNEINSEDFFAALSDLEVLANGLLQLESSYFNTP